MICNCNLTSISRFLLFLNQMIKRLRHLHRAWVIFVIVFFFILFYPFYYFAARHPRRYGLLNKLRRWNGYCSSFFSGIFFRLHYELPLKEEQTYIYCANHSSNLDIIVFCLVARGRFHFMGKEELLNNPVLKLFFKTIDIPVNRERNISAFRAFKRAGDNLASGMSLIIFPEGGINAEVYPPALQPFKNGPFRLAIEQQVHIIPVSISNAWQKMWDDGEKYGTSPGICDIYIHKPIATDHYSLEHADLLKDEVFSLINSKLVTE